MKTIVAIWIALCGAVSSAAGQGAFDAGCPGGYCPSVPYTVPADTQPYDTRAVVRIANARGAQRVFGSGTLVEFERHPGLVVSCAHLFRDGVGTIQVRLADGRSLDAKLLSVDNTADLSALQVADPSIPPVSLAETFPQRGDPLVSCGYGSDGRVFCNRGQALGYVQTVGSHGRETLELSGIARMGDSGGPIFDRQHRLAGVLYGTDGRVVDGTFCGRVKLFLAGLQLKQAPAPPIESKPIEPPSVNPPPAVVDPDHAQKLEGIAAALQASWKALGAKIDRLLERASAVSAAPPPTTPVQVQPPKVELPAEADAIGAAADAVAAAGRPWLTAKLAALLVSVGVPGGVAGVAAGAVVWLVMRRGRRRLQAQLNRLKSGGTGGTADEPPDPAVVEMHHNRYVPYEVTALDKAWAAAHAHVGEKYPGAVPYLKIAEGVKDQLLSGKTDS